MDRNKQISDLVDYTNKKWDIIVVGGGATGLGTALDASSRGFKTLLLERADFGSGTSSRSTKLVHGGVRYLAKGDLLLVVEALRERGLMLKNAPHLTRNQEFIIPLYSIWDVVLYYIGLKFYDLLSGRLSLGKSHYISRITTISRLPLIKRDRLKGGIVYHDGQFDDARMAISLAASAIKKGATVLNYFNVSSLLKDEEGKIAGVKARDKVTGTEYTINSKLVINATGVFADYLHRIDNPGARATIRPSQGVHIVLDQSFLQSNSAIMIPKTSDGRVLFAIPWHGKVVVGTTDTPLNEVSEEPVALEQEINFILETAGRCLTRQPERKDIQSIFAGLRPLAAYYGSGGSTREVSRRHKIILSPSGLLTIVGGKWTTYRCMAEETIDKAARAGLIEKRKCVTRHLALEEAAGPGFPCSDAEINRIIMDEMPCKIDDILARRTRALFLDARASIIAAPSVASLLAGRMGYDKKWQEDSVEAFNKLALTYL